MASGRRLSWKRTADPARAPFGSQAPPLQWTSCVTFLCVLIAYLSLTSDEVLSGESQLALGLGVLGGVAYLANRLRYEWRRRRGEFADEPARFTGTRWRVHDGLVVIAALAAASAVVPVGLVAALASASLYRGGLWMADWWYRRRKERRSRGAPPARRRLSGP
jgi:hypothetical protein